jgi:hypothetical protein
MTKKNAYGAWITGWRCMWGRILTKRGVCWAMAEKDVSRAGIDVYLWGQTLTEGEGSYDQERCSWIQMTEIGVCGDWCKGGVCLDGDLERCMKVIASEKKVYVADRDRQSVCGTWWPREMYESLDGWEWFLCSRMFNRCVWRWTEFPREVYVDRAVEGGAHDRESCMRGRTS